MSPLISISEEMLHMHSNYSGFNKLYMFCVQKKKCDNQQNIKPKLPDLSSNREIDIK